MQKLPLGGRGRVSYSSKADGVLTPRQPARTYHARERVIGAPLHGKAGPDPLPPGRSNRTHSLSSNANHRNLETPGGSLTFGVPAAQPNAPPFHALDSLNPSGRPQGWGSGFGAPHCP